MLIVEFANNNNVLIFINMLSFYTNKEFHSRISFNSNIIDYIITRKRLDVVKIKDIIDYMQNILIFIRDRLNRV